jgi:electron transfer flavoprotein beta subunit
MNIITLVKQVPDTGQLSSTMDGLKLLAEGSPRMINPWDEYALEAAIQLKEAHGGKVTALCLGPADAVEALKRGLAMGADEAILISDPALAGGDSLATARALAAAINKLDVCDLVIAGRSAVDGNTGATAIQVAALLGVPPLSFVAEIKAVDPAAKTITVVRLLESGRETVHSRLPAVVTVVKEINEPRYPSFMGIRKAAKAAIPTWDLAALGLAPAEAGAAGSQLRWSELALPPVRDRGAEILSGSPAEIARALADRLAEEKLI